MHFQDTWMTNIENYISYLEVIYHTYHYDFNTFPSLGGHVTHRSLRNKYSFLNQVIRSWAKFARFQDQNNSILSFLITREPN